MTDSDEEAERRAWTKVARDGGFRDPSDYHFAGFEAGAAHARKQAEQDHAAWPRRAVEIGSSRNERIAALERVVDRARLLAPGIDDWELELRLRDLDSGGSIAEPEQRHNGPLDAFSIVGKDRDDWKRRALAAEQRIAALERCVEAAYRWHNGEGDDDGNAARHEFLHIRRALKHGLALDALKDSGPSDEDIHNAFERARIDRAIAYGANPNDPALKPQPYQPKPAGPPCIACSKPSTRLSSGIDGGRPFCAGCAPLNSHPITTWPQPEPASFLTRAELARLCRKASIQWPLGYENNAAVALTKLAEAAESEDG